MTLVRVPASASNLGAGFDCVGLALELWLEARLVAGAGAPVYSGTLTGIAPDKDIVLRALGGQPPAGFRLHVHSDIPVSRGLGSSGAAAVAGAVLKRHAARQPVDRHDVFEAAARAEGHPDNAAPAVFGGLVLALPQPISLALHPRFGIACAVPESPVDTAAARALLPLRVSRAKAVSQASANAALLLGLTRGEPDLVRDGMRDLIAVPRRKRLIPGFEQAVRAGVKVGAYGVTISGSGSTLIAICPREAASAVADALATALGRAANPARAMVPEVCAQGFAVES